MEPLIHSTRPLAFRRGLCASCSRLWGEHVALLAPLQRTGLQNSDRIQRRFKGYIAPAGGQARPLEGFYKELSKPLSQVQPLTRTAPEAPPPESLPETQKEETLAKARIIFGSRLAGPGERQAEIAMASRDIAGVMVPPRPTEPDNCCMSGCVNCVWDMYRDEMEEWAAKSSEARAALQASRDGSSGSGRIVAVQGTPAHVAASMDDDGGGSEANWSAGTDEANLFDDIPVGIREFMKTEKKLKLQHTKEQAASA
ncbi:oxidoreductase-like protein [Massariosphaeria phaeospora]|uniref:Oxidoreductase-like protein n=1 Tax=Massariosphaeria phaeospora TaxID=100035 RepID=A0A7C8MCK5_9PLEO|nr:oxidoreductase-like protein [Massariosphaeria phaeospora]